MSGTTNQLVEWATDVGPIHDAREYDVVVATGEQVTAGLLAIALQNLGVDARSWLGWQIVVQTDDIHSSARIEDIDVTRLEDRLAHVRLLLSLALGEESSRADYHTCRGDQILRLSHWLQH